VHPSTHLCSVSVVLCPAGCQLISVPSADSKSWRFKKLSAQDVWCHTSGNVRTGCWTVLSHSSCWDICLSAPFIFWSFMVNTCQALVVEYYPKTKYNKSKNVNDWQVRCLNPSAAGHRTYRSVDNFWLLFVMYFGSKLMLVFIIDTVPKHLACVS